MQFSTLTFVVEVVFNLRTFSQVLTTVIKYFVFVVFFILKCIINFLNVECNHEELFYILLIQAKKNEQTKLL